MKYLDEKDLIKILESMLIELDESSNHYDIGYNNAIEDILRLIKGENY